MHLKFQQEGDNGQVKCVLLYANSRDYCSHDMGYVGRGD